MSVETPRALGNGRYQLLERLSDGQRGTVWRAMDLKQNAPRVVKLLAPALARQATARERFERGARAMIALSHPNVVKVHEMGADGDLVFMVMEHCAGGSLKHRLDKLGRLPPRLAVEVARGILNALQFAHAKGIVHRSVCSDNVLVDGLGTPKLADFGEAHVEKEQADPRLTMAGQIMGVWAFIAPEQRRGAVNATAQSDIYSVAATLYNMVTGHPPPDLYLAEFKDTLLDPLPASMRPLVQKASAFQVEKRYASANDMTVALMQLQVELPAPGPGDPNLLTPLPA